MAVMLSIQPKWCELIASGKKTIEVRKTKPKCKTPFKCYIYETMTGYVSRSKQNDGLIPINYMGKVIGEFVCREVGETYFIVNSEDELLFPDIEFPGSCLTNREIYRYTKGDRCFEWHISDLVIYDKPKELSEFGLKRPFQSWGYCEELGEKQ